MKEIVLSIEDLKTYFFTDDGVVKAVDGVSYKVGRGQTVAVVGESGSGKSVTALSIIQLVSRPGKIVGGKIWFKGTDLLSLPEREMRKIRGKNISMIFQEPMTSLNPVFTVGNQIMEAISLHMDLSKSDAKARTIELLSKVKIPEPAKRFNQYPHELSGGMRQRVMIAMALSCNPDLLLADEPTTALDVTVQAQILTLLKDLQQQFGMSIILITHDLGIVAEVADDVVVMYASKVVEYGTARDVLGNPKHPYTVALMKSRPHLESKKGERLTIIEGMVPNPLNHPTGCRFHPRCYLRKGRDQCKNQEPLHTVVSTGDEGTTPHITACHFSNEVNHNG